ncbi:hypothetical protein SAMN06264364_11155 [Quadrisphaera granulorum]|uniref:Arc-like DNA binding dprotein n=1 Tax=Quadrisphaera granulorum TaxID=317664 RepID=A0A316A834_9ACTN|nr:hypothetical protein [Quadrisphaera granulorum]PWJ53652.1 hypothetical protein BXY45_11155 [Quadrisphaera granulorum]SZE96696.1 hypothetical protein SAMN06264364_11155 [Quadrisphaera granulorum]
MPDVLIRDVPSEDLEVIRSVAAERGLTLQAYLLSAVQMHAAHERRQQTLRALERTLHGLPPVALEDRQSVLDAIGEALAERSDGLVARRGEPQQQ